MDFKNIRENIEDVKILSTEKISDSKYIKPMRVTYMQAGVKKTWDYMKVHDSVAVLIFNVTSQKVVMVQQFRPAVYMASHSKLEGSNQAPSSSGVTYELCAGIIDRDASPREIAASEVFEETGYKVMEEKLEPIVSFRSGIGVSGNVQHMFYVEVDDTMKATDGGGCEHEGEMIDLFHLKLSEIKIFLSDSSKLIKTPSGALYALSWFLNNKVNESLKQYL
ncbi:unnamed protein product [Clavelina lepadiformis]|uniref:Nudix hydrolase domain-containing protein n=1 Tax=Clavelina lepadiformis TaxID=159417 RepID=A0ABP0GKX5_CLALP